MINSDAVHVTPFTAVIFASYKPNKKSVSLKLDFITFSCEPTSFLTCER